MNKNTVENCNTGKINNETGKINNETGKINNEPGKINNKTEIIFIWASPHASLN